mmetsp:Transcript_9097/g.26065  ORF Transcript_9097/g.26065 Transcript_9097/m.26065 type:complete len:383 (+) Transcript_9097:72-1220(+)
MRALHVSLVGAFAVASLAREAAARTLAGDIAHVPKRYVARRGTPTAINGNVHKAEWERAPWSEPFVEIRGPDAPEGSGPTPAQATRMKMLWDDDFLYVAAFIDFAGGDEITANFTERNSPIYQLDSDFEVFLDPSGCCHGYKELELNAINTVWNLQLTKPYGDGGRELSGRVAKPGEADFWDVQAQKTAARVTKGALHRTGEPSQWVCELALSHRETQQDVPVPGATPAVGRSWRINFSRVEKRGAVNWVWSPQVVFDPVKHRYSGLVAMHLPDAWGYVVFADEDGRFEDAREGDTWVDAEGPARRAASAAYYAAKQFESSQGRPPASAEELEGLLRGAGLGDARLHVAVAQGGGWEITATEGGYAATISNDRLLRVAPVGA